MNFLKKLFNKQTKVQSETPEDFWSWFKENSKEFYNVVNNQNDIPNNFFNKIAPKIKSINSNFWYECGMYDDNTAELIITVEANLKEIAFAEEFISSAPNIKNWKFTALKEENSMDSAKISMGDITFDKSNIFFSPIVLPEFPDEVELKITHAELNDENIEECTRGCLIFLDHFLGELNSITLIDNLSIVSKEDVNDELIPIEKLKEYLNWRETEFLEKYQGLRYNTEKDTYTSYEGKFKNGLPSIAVMNSNLLNWEAKASHPWISILSFTYNGDDTNGLPSSEDYELLDTIEDELCSYLVDFDGHLNIGRTTGDNLRHLYIASKEFRKPSMVTRNIISKYEHEFKIEHDLFKDKYWKCLSHFKV